MAGSFLVIGLGQFGSGIARELTGHGGDVIAIDLHESPVDAIGPHVSRALRLDATDEHALAELEPSRLDAVICAIGAESIEASILVTALLKELGAKRIITRVTSDLHARVIKRIGADELINPEHEIARHVVQRVLLPTLRTAYEIADGITVAEFCCPQKFINKPIRELALRSTHGVNIIAVKRANGHETIGVPSPDTVVYENDSILVVGKMANVERISKES